MVEKTIKTVLRKKVNDWADSVSDAATRQIIKEKSIITGGSIVSMLMGDEVNDYDVYFRDKESAKAVAEYYVNAFKAAHPDKYMKMCVQDDNGRLRIFVKGAGAVGDDDYNMVSGETEPNVDAEIVDKAEDAGKPAYRPVWLSTNAITLSDKIQIVVRFYGEPDQIHETYDYVHCTCYWQSWNGELVLPARALSAIINKELYYMGSKYPLCSIIRSRKFISRGWHINAGQYVKMALQLNELDLHDMKVFEDQLVGVDSAYFNSAIYQIQQQQMNDPNFNVDNNYLFEIINRIF
jgi:hypothetical protein